jgi:hypothetical protein
MPTVQFGYSRDERVYFLLESTYGQTPNTSGVSNLTGSNCCSIISVDLDPDVDLYDSEYKTGSRSIIPGVTGRRIGTFRISFPLKGSGTIGVPPDYAPVLTSMFGQQTINSGASVFYTIVDTPAQTFSMFRYRSPAGLYQQLGISCIPTRTVWNLGQNMANWSVEGQCFWVLDSEQFAAADSQSKGGLTSFPTEPTTPVTNGTQAPGYKGQLIIDGNTMVNIQQMTLTADWGWAHNRTFFGTDYANGVLGGIRRVTATMEAFDDNSSAMLNLRAKGISKTPMQIGAQIGSVPGNIHYFTISNCQLDFPKMIDTGDRFGQRWAAIVAHETTPGAKDELVHFLG